MAKKVMGADGKMYKVKKPFYKKVWFWVLTVIVLVGVGSQLGGDKNEASNGGTKVETTAKSSSKAKDEKKEKLYKVGDTVKVGDATYTLKSVALTDERNEFDDSNPANVVKIEYTVQNNGKEDIPVGMDVEVYDAEDTKMETYPNDNTMGAVAPGKNMNVVAHYGLEKTGDIEIYFAPLISFEDAAIFEANVQ